MKKVSVAFGHCVVLQGDYTDFVLVKFFSSPLCSHILSYGVVFFRLAHQVCAAWCHPYQSSMAQMNNLEWVLPPADLVVPVNPCHIYIWECHSLAIFLLLQLLLLFSWEGKNSNQLLEMGNKKHFVLWYQHIPFTHPMGVSQVTLTLSCRFVGLTRTVA